MYMITICGIKKIRTHLGIYTTKISTIFKYEMLTINTVSVCLRNYDFCYSDTGFIINTKQLLLLYYNTNSLGH